MKFFFVLCAVADALCVCYDLQRQYYYAAAAMVALGLISLIEYAKEA